MPAPTADLIAWLTSDLGWDVTQETGAPLVAGPYVPDEPDRLVVVTAVTGPGFLLDDAADAGAFQARVRGGQNDPGDSEALAYALDDLILGASFPVALAGGKTLIHCHRLSASPAPLSGQEDDGDRVEFVTTYLALVSSALAA